MRRILDVFVFMLFQSFEHVQRRKITVDILSITGEETIIGKIQSFPQGQEIITVIWANPFVRNQCAGLQVVN